MKIDGVIKLEIAFEINIGSNSITDYWKLSSISPTSYNKSETGTITINITRNFTGVSSVRLNVEGAKEAGEDKGFGKHYTGSGIWVNVGYEHNYTTVSFAEEDVSKDITLTVINNPIIEMKKNLSIYLSNPGNGGIASTTKTISIVDDNIPVTSGHRNIINVLYPNADYDNGGAVGRGLTALDPTADIDNTTNFLAQWSWLQENGGGIIYFPNGSYDFKDCHNLAMKKSSESKGITVWGESKTGTIIRKWWTTASYADNHAYWETWAMDATWGNTGTPGESAPISFTKFTFDGQGVANCARIKVNSIPDNNDFINFTFEKYNQADTYYKYYFKDSPSSEEYIETIYIVRDIDRAGTVADITTRLMSAMTAQGFTCTVITGYTDWFNMYYSNQAYINFTGSSTEHLAYVNTEQAICIYMGPGTTAKQNGAIHVGRIEDVIATGCTASGFVTFGANTKSKTYHITDNYEYGARGTLSYTGTNISAAIHDIEGYQLHIEMSGTGYDSGAVANYQYNFEVYDSTFDIFGLGCYAGATAGIIDADSTFIGARVNVNTRLAGRYSGYFGYGPGISAGTSPTAEFTLTDFNIICGDRSTFVYPVNTTWTRCDFTGLFLNSTTYAVATGIQIIGTLTTRVTYTYSDCDFSLSDDLPDGLSTLGIGLMTAASTNADGKSNIKFVVSDSRWNSDFTYCVGSSNGRGGWWVLGPNNTYKGSHLSKWHHNATNKNRFELDGTGSTYDLEEFLYISGNENDGAVMILGDVELPASMNLHEYYTGSSWTTWSNPTKIDISKMAGATYLRRIIGGAAPPQDNLTIGYHGSSDGSFDIFEDEVNEKTYKLDTMSTRDWSEVT